MDLSLLVTEKLSKASLIYLYFIKTSTIPLANITQTARDDQYQIEVQELLLFVYPTRNQYQYLTHPGIHLHLEPI